MQLREGGIYGFQVLPLHLSGKVSAKTSKIPHIPCTTGSLTLELEWTITLEPRPASLENGKEERAYGALALGYPDSETGLPEHTPKERTGNRVTYVK